jgi:hypothetical protein
VRFDREAQSMQFPPLLIPRETKVCEPWCCLQGESE